MPRKSSIHFKPVSNVRFAVSHSERTDLSEPAYLLPKEYQLDNIVVTGSLSENYLAALFIQQKEGMTGQAKARGSSPFWEGVVVLPNTDGLEQSANLQSWKKEYEKATGHKVLHMSVHLDEGYLDALGKPQYNPHAHVIVTRMDSKNRVISLDRKQLAAVQDLTAETLQMERGSTLSERQGKRGRKHVPHREFRAQADATRLKLDGVKAVNTEELDKVKTSRDNFQKLFAADTPLINKLKEDKEAAESEVSKKAARIARLTELKDGYKRDRAKLKASGIATQKDYQDLKIKYEADLAKLEKELETAQIEAAKVPALEAKITQQAAAFDKLKTEALGIIAPLREEAKTMKTQITQLTDEKAQLAKDLADARRFAAMGNNYQADKAAGTPAHEIVPDPAPRTSQSNPLTPAPMPAVAQLGPNARAKLRAEQMALAAAKRAQEPPKQSEAPTTSPTPIKSLAERIADFVKGLIEQFGKQPSELSEGSLYVGKVLAVMDGAWAQKVSREGDWVVHQGKSPALESIAEVAFKGGESKVKGIESGKGGIGG